MRQLPTSLVLGPGIIWLGCASIMHGTNQDIGFSSSPTNATVTVDGALLGRTPLTSKLNRKDNHIVRVELEGYMPYEATFTRSVSGWVWGNILFGGLIGLAIDAISGGLYKLTPEQLNAELRKATVSVRPPDDLFHLSVVLKPDPSWEKVGNLNRSS